MASQCRPDHGCSAPMWVVKVGDFLQFDELPCHEQLFASGLLCQRQEGFFCIFVSHQWLGVTHADPKGEQLAVLQAALRQLIAGKDILPDVLAQYYGSMPQFSDFHRLKEAYVWMDWLSVPQQVELGSVANEEVSEVSPVSTSTASPTCSAASQEDFIQSIPEYVETSDMFMVLTPQSRHAVTGASCNFSSWCSRGWCRLELWCKMLSNVKKPAVIVLSADHIQFASSFFWIDYPPHEGEFSYDSDRRPVSLVAKKLLSAKLRSLRASKKWDLFRYYMARYETLLGKPWQKRTLEDFRRDFKFDSLDVRREAMTPLACAVLSGDAEMVRELCKKKSDVNKSAGALYEVYIYLPVSPLMLAVFLGRNLEVATVLLEQKADCNATNPFNMQVLSYCRSEAAVELLIQHRADVNLQKAPENCPPISWACSLGAPSAVIARLLHHGAQVNPTNLGFASGHPLASVALTKSVSPYGTEVVAMLLDARADANRQYHASGIWRARELACRAILRLGGRRVPRVVLCFAEWSTTSLGFACLSGDVELVEMLLEASADPEIPNERGHTPLQLAQTEAVVNAIRHHQTTFSI
ncbi:unnamed protein product [Effrenium voratum]|uniref:Uncharacterized protein n=1 Tax=Effrenium voratum TaxID=2562239 RepID=A0AA36IWM6_9DINO|nr:unnamed protein product [Effrenium voratum]CAJ1413650.1 unnamed protein product [Effrenium voratum]